MSIKKHIIAGLILSTPWLASAGLSSTEVAQFTQKTTLKFGVVDNFHNNDASFIAKIALQNDSAVSLPSGKSDWQIYIHSVRKIDTQIVKGIKFEHVNGDLHKLTPTEEFKGLASGEALTLEFEAAVWIVAYTDFMPRAFMTVNNQSPSIFSNTDSEDMLKMVLPLKNENQIRKFNTPKDLSVIATAKNRYQHNATFAQYQVTEQDALKRIIPQPQEVDFNRGETRLNDNWVISFQGALTKEVAVFQSDLEKYYGLKLEAKADHLNPSKQSVIRLKRDPKFNAGKAESYQLEIEKSRITILGSDNAGVFYGLQSLLALMPANTQGDIYLPRVEIKDAPRYGYRGMHYDNARNYHGKAAMFKLVEQMAKYKLNTLHWHFSDDEGWRVEIPSLPELTEIGGHRCFDLTEQRCLLTQLGTGPLKSGSGNGFLSKDDFVELLKFAAARHIQIIPEIESPGHARAAIKAMEARYYRLVEQGDKTAASAYLLSDLNDTSAYNTVQNYTDNSVNVCLESSYNFIDKVTYELQQMYREAGVRLAHVHFGGDEVGAGSWVGSPACQALIEKPANGVSGVADLKPYFTARVANLLHKRGIAPGAWEDGLMYDRVNTFNRDEFPNQVFTANAWDNIWEWGVADRAYRLANAGYQVVLSHGTHLYFDHPYEAHPQERGYYWATRATSNEKVFGYMPDDVYANADFTRAGERIENLEALVGRPLPQLEKPENILGMQGQVWSETIRTESQVLAMLFPRVLAVAERAWHKASWEGQSPDLNARNKQWYHFAAAMGMKELAKLAQSGISPYLDVPGGVIEQGFLKANVAIPYLAIEYSLNNGADWQLYRTKVSVKQGQKVLLRSSLNDHVKSRITTLN